MELEDRAEAITEYIVLHHSDIPVEELHEEQSNSDVRYSERVQDIFNNVLSILEIGYISHDKN